VNNDASSVSIVIAIPPGLPILPCLRFSSPFRSAPLPTDNHVRVAPANADRGYPVRAKRIGVLRAARRAQTHPGAYVPHRASFIPVHSRRGTTPDDLPVSGEREIPPGEPLNQYSTSSAPTVNTLTILSGPRARVSACPNKIGYIFAGTRKKRTVGAKGAVCMRRVERGANKWSRRGPLCNNQPVVREKASTALFLNGSIQ